jgi:hypothetical protein
MQSMMQGDKNTLKIIHETIIMGRTSESNPLKYMRESFLDEKLAYKISYFKAPFQ